MAVSSLGGLGSLAAVTLGPSAISEVIGEIPVSLDLIVASGFEGGGHRGSFLCSPSDSLMGSFALVPQVVDAVAVPVIAAGGIADGRGLVAALALGS